MILRETQHSSGYFRQQQEQGQANVLCLHVAGSLSSEGRKVCLWMCS
jgi:hypothetical protein